MSIVLRIKDLCAEKNITVKKLEEVTGLGNGTIRRWDDTSPSVEKINKVAAYLEVSLDYLAIGSEKYAPLSDGDAEWLRLIHSLPPETQRDFLGAMRLHSDLYGNEKEELKEAK